ncbi:MAG: asparagine synthase-related protein [Phycisphaerales bacterium]
MNRVRDDSEAPAPCLQLHLDDAGRLTDASGTRSWSTGAELPSDGPMRNGVFARWSASDERALVETDSLGLQSLFVARTTNRIFVSPSIPTLLASLRAMHEMNPTEAADAVAFDFDAIAAFCIVGFFVGDRTPFAGIRAAPPGWRLESDAAGTRITQFEPNPEITQLDDEALVDELIRRFRTSVERRVANATRPEIVTLTGGKDSRHIAHELARQVGKANVRAVTVERLRRAGDDDTSVAVRVAAGLGIDHQAVPGTAFTLAHEYSKNVATNFNAMDHGWAHPLGAVFQPGDRVWDGLSGDVVIDGTYSSRAQLDAARSGDRVAWSQRLTTIRGGTQRLIHASMGELAPSLDVAAGCELLQAEMAQHLDRPNPVSSFWFWNRTRRAVSVAATGLYGSGVDVVFPFADTDLWSLGMSVPGERMIGQHLQRQMLERDHPDAMILPFANSDFSLRARIARLPNHVRRLGGAFAADGRGVVERARIAGQAASLLARPGRRSECIMYPLNVSRLRAWRRSIERASRGSMARTER